MRENTKTFILKSGRGRLQEVVVYYKALGGKILVFWIGRTWRFDSIVLTFIYLYCKSNLLGHSAPVRMEWHDAQSTREVTWGKSHLWLLLEGSVREVKSEKKAEELQSAKGLEKLSVITGAR